MSNTGIFLATAIDKEIGSTTSYLMNAQRFSRILGEDADGIAETLAQIEEETPAQIFTSVKDLITFLQQNSMEIAEEAVGVFDDNGAEDASKG